MRPYFHAPRLLLHLISCLSLVSTTYIYTVRSNISHLGVVRASNLCTEIVQISSQYRVAVCTLASVALPRFLLPGQAGIDYSHIHSVVKVIVRNLDRLIEVTDYPRESAYDSAHDLRALGIGVQGLADVFAALELPFDSPDARQINVRIFETLYHAALEASTELAQLNLPCPSYLRSPASRGVLQMDMWGADPTGLHDFAPLRHRIAHFGLRNTLLTAQMPTASSSQILGHSEGVDPYLRLVCSCVPSAEFISNGISFTPFL